MTFIMTSPSDENIDSSAPVLLTVADIVRYKADYEADVRLLEELPARIKLKKRKYEAALMFAPPGFDPDTPVAVTPARLPIPTRQPEPEPDKPFELVQEAEEIETEGRVTWIGELRRLLAAANRGVAHQEALASLKSTPLGDRTSAGDKGFYNAVSRLEKRGELVKASGLLYSKKMADEMVARGEPLPGQSLESRRRAGSSAAIVLQVLREHPEGLIAPDLKDAAAAVPGAPESIAKHGQYIYNVLSTLIGQCEVEKDANGVYRIREIA